MSERPFEDAVPAAPATRFGVRLGGVAVALPAGTPLEFVTGASIYPLPLAPARVAGLMPLRGQPMVVLDPAAAPAAAASIRRHDVLVIGQPPQAAALLVDAPPRPLEAGRWRRADAAPSGCAFAAALRLPGEDRAGPDGPDAAPDTPGTACADAEAWHEIDPARLFDVLARS